MERYTADTVEFALPSSFWPTVYRLAGGQAWPPRDVEEASLLVNRAIPEGLLSLLIREPDLPPEVYRTARKHQALERSNRLRSRMFEESLTTVLDVLDGESIIVLKGTDYAYRLYPEPHLRPRQDIDVLVRRDRADAITDRLKAAGFKLHFTAGAVARVGSYHQRVFEVGNATVEVHHAFIQRARNRVDYKGVWERARSWNGFDRRAFQLDDVDRFLFHAINMGADQFSNPIFRHLDVWLMLRNRGDMLSTVVARAREWSTARALYGALRQTSRYFPEFRTPAVDQALLEILPLRTRAFLDSKILPDPWLPRKKYRRAGQLWRKFWLIDDGLHRASFALYHVWEVVGGKVLEVIDRE